MHHISKTKKVFTTGEARYCQNCGNESQHLALVTHGTPHPLKLQYCEKCKAAYDKKSGSSGA